MGVCGQIIPVSKTWCFRNSVLAQRVVWKCKLLSVANHCFLQWWGRFCLHQPEGLLLCSGSTELLLSWALSKIDFVSAGETKPNLFIGVAWFRTTIKFKPLPSIKIKSLCDKEIEFVCKIQCYVRDLFLVPGSKHSKVVCQQQSHVYAVIRGCC